MNIGILGSGFIVEVFVKNSKKYKDLNLYGIWGRHEEKIKRFNGFKLYTTNVDELLNDPNIDVVYVALPNSLHFEYAYKALKANKHVMLEKPFCTSYKQAQTLINYAKKHNLLLYETAMTPHGKNYLKMKTFIDKLGEIKMIDINFSQYSRKYDKFKNGIILPAFDKKLAGGALFDLNVYNIHFVVGMFGLPKKVNYFPNIYRNIDTSGILVLDYGKFKANLVAGKDCSAPAYAMVQGDKGYLRCTTTTSRCEDFEVVMNDGKVKKFKGKDDEFAGWKTMYEEFIRLYKNKDYQTCYKYLDQTLMVQKVLEGAMNSANIKH